MVRIAAYFRAERRGFAPGNECEDWLAAEAEVSERSPGHAGRARRARPRRARQRAGWRRHRLTVPQSGGRAAPFGNSVSS